MTDTAPISSELGSLDPRVRTRWWITSGLVAVVSLGIAVAAYLIFSAVLEGDSLEPDAVGIIEVLRLWPSIITAVVVLPLCAIIPPVRYSRWSYVVRDEDIWIRRGLLTVTVTVVPFSRLQFVDTERGLLDRMLGIASLVLHTAALNTQTTIPGLALAEAEGLRERLADVDPDVVSV